MLVLVIYDIADDRRRQKLSTYLEGYGRRVQESCFECFLSLDGMSKLFSRVKKRVDIEEDNVRFYWIPADSLGRTLTIGSLPPEPPPKAYIV